VLVLSVNNNQTSINMSPQRDDISTISNELLSWSEDAGYLAIPPFSHKVFYKEFGDSNASPAKTLLLLHGFPESSYSYNKIIGEMMQIFDRIILFDMIGYGFSDKPVENYSYSLIEQADVALQVWQHLGVTGGHVISHDMGTSVLTEIVARHVAGLLPKSFCDGLQSLTFTNGSMVLAFSRLRVMQKMLLSRVGGFVSRFSNDAMFAQALYSAHGVPSGQANGISKQDVDLLWENYSLQQGHKKSHLMIRYIYDRKRYEKTRWLPSLTIASESIPVHFCWGDADQVAGFEMVKYLHSTVCPKATLTPMPGVGHFGQIGSPQTWVENIGQFYRLLNQ